ncbi:hypothetical protein [Amycolatopsis magusensis]|uniref:Ribosomal protein L7/L12 n=1 Tax=Amycolatopsis magusensis TaxID=882444 RepID=A0ABS4PSZ4_9PSEU|nr:hypothetical protein [Amycolatopsis magusensis]MBP2182554.1 ribosomal protein L7/L12 [Amycolatopsis magusensis]MDI5980519.1 hypothetical protein [Amycolatopsis magusensis]UJW31276.1 hypothetical protein L3Q67_39825 [Saccharothrix sp. AJ9571]
MDYGLFLLAGVLIVLAAVTLSASAMERRAGKLDRRLARVEEKLDAVLAHHGITLPEPDFAEVRAHLAEGRKILAIKAYRERTGASLQEAKEAVERL